jgi:hypothetical protein
MVSLYKKNPFYTMKHLELLYWLFSVQQMSPETILEQPPSFFIKQFGEDIFVLEFNTEWVISKKRII